MNDRNGNLQQIVSIGFMPLLDCALLVTAHEKGFAAQQGLRLRLVREVSWANVRDRVMVGHFDAAQMLGPMVLASHLRPTEKPCVAPVALGVGGNAVTVSTELWRRMRDHGAKVGARPDVQARALAGVVAARTRVGLAPLTLAMVFPFSCHNYQLRDWLTLGGIDPERDVRLVVVPPPLLVEAIRTGQVDGFCVGEPWGSLAVDAGLGAMVAVGSEIWPRPPEKVLGLRADFLECHPEVVAALVRAVAAAADWAGEPGNRPELARLLAQSRYVGASQALLLAALNGDLVMEPGGEALPREGFLVLNRDAIRPRAEDAAMLLERMQRCGQLPADSAAVARAAESFRADVHAAALAIPLDASQAGQG